MAWKRTAGTNDVVVAVNFGDEDVSMALNLDDSYAAAWGDLAPSAEALVPAHAAAVWTRTRRE